MIRSMARLTLAVGMLALLTVASVPAGAEHTTNPKKDIDEVGFHGLGNKGFNTDIMPWVSQNGGVYAATGTWGSVLAPTDDCPSETDITGEESGVHIIDASEPENPTIATRLRTIPGAQNNDVKVARLPTVNGDADILVHSLEPCGVEGALHQIPGSPFIDFATLFLQQIQLDQTGFQIYDVDDPESPVKHAAWNNGGVGTHNLWVFSQGDRSFVAAVFNKVDQLGVEEEHFITGILQIVEITNPDDPELVSEWRLSDAELDCPARGNDSDHCFLHDVTVSADGNTAYLSFWDAGLVLLDISDPANPAFIGRALDQVQNDDPEGWLNEEGNTHAAVPTEVDGRKLVVVGDEDFTGGGEIGVTVNSPASLADFYQAVQWAGTAEANGQTADFVYVGAGCHATDYALAGGPSAVEGKIVFVDHRAAASPFPECVGPYTFFQKVNLAALNGAIGFVQFPGPAGPNTNATAGSATIPGLELFHNPETQAVRDAVVASSPVVNPISQGPAVNAKLGRGGTVGPWGFMRVVDVTAEDGANWREVSQFKAPHVEDASPGPEDVFSAHNPVVGPDGRIYFSWYTDGVRVLELSNGGATVTEKAWFVPLPGDHEGDNDEDPHGVQEANTGFWGSWPLCDPETQDLLIFNSDLNRGIYILEAQYDNCRPDLIVSDITFSKTKVRGGDRVTVTAHVTNQGISNVLGSFLVRFTDNGVQLGLPQISGLAAGETKTVSVMWNTKHLKGNHVITATADWGNAVGESNEDNNSRSETVLVRGNKTRER